MQKLKILVDLIEYSFVDIIRFDGLIFYYVIVMFSCHIPKKAFRGHVIYVFNVI